MKFPLFKPVEKRDLNVIAFYNLENLFDTISDPNHNDDDFTPEGSKKWSLKRYKKKLYKLGKVLSKVGKQSSDGPPVLIGVAEVENKTALEHLISSQHLSHIDYGYIHYDSPDKRGIDCALIYHKPFFTVEHSQPIPLLIVDPLGNEETTRDILYVRGKLNGEELHIFVNHWPSRHNKTDDTEFKRIKAAETLLAFIASIKTNTKIPNYIIMGDFNDGPASNSIKNLVESEHLFNPMEKLLTPDRGSANYLRTWMLFDQIIVSSSFLDQKKGTHSFAHANIFDDQYLTEFKGRYKGSPYRTYAGHKYIGGYSDHFPVYITLKYNQ